VHLNQVLDQRSVELPFKMPISLSPSMASKSTAHIAVAHKTWYVDVKRISRPTQFAVLPARMSSHDARSMVSRNTQSRGTRTLFTSQSPPVQLLGFPVILPIDRGGCGGE